MSIQDAADPFAYLMGCLKECVPFFFTCVDPDAANSFILAVDVDKEAHILRYILSFIRGAAGAKLLKIYVDVADRRITVQRSGEFLGSGDAGKRLLLHEGAVHAETGDDDWIAIFE